MKIKEVKSLMFSSVKVITFSRFQDHRGYFTEHFNSQDFLTYPSLPFMRDFKIHQANESFSRKGTVRGLHFQWHPMMGKLVRTLSGHMVDLVMDIRKDSPTFGCCIAYDMPHDPESEDMEWIWVPIGFAHGNYYLEDSRIEYFCTGTYSPDNEGGISPLAKDIDWSLCDSRLLRQFEKIVKGPDLLISIKDRNGFTVTEWDKNENSQFFKYGRLLWRDHI